MTIPKIIHHIWMGKKTIPDVNLYCANSIKETNPDFDYILWKDDDVDKVCAEIELFSIPGPATCPIAHSPA